MFTNISATFQIPLKYSFLNVMTAGAALYAVMENLLKDFYRLFSPADSNSHTRRAEVMNISTRKQNYLKEFDPDVLISPSAHNCRGPVEQLLYAFTGVHVVPHVQPYGTILAEPSDE